jgi:hypothetical protein
VVGFVGENHSRQHQSDMSSGHSATVDHALVGIEESWLATRLGRRIMQTVKAEQLSNWLKLFVADQLFEPMAHSWIWGVACLLNHLDSPLVVPLVAGVVARVVLQIELAVT